MRPLPSWCTHPGCHLRPLPSPCLFFRSPVCRDWRMEGFSVNVFLTFSIHLVLGDQKETNTMGAGLQTGSEPWRKGSGKLHGAVAMRTNFLWSSVRFALALFGSSFLMRFFGRRSRCSHRRDERNGGFRVRRQTPNPPLALSQETSVQPVRSHPWCHLVVSVS